MSVVKRRRALALGSGITLLGVLRALSKAKVEVLALPDADKPARRSRYYRTAASFLSGVSPASLATNLPRVPVDTVLMPCSDQWARTVAALPAEVLARYPASVPPLEAIELLVDKGKFGSALKRLGLPHPATRLVTSRQDLDGIPDSLLENSFLKPVHSQQFFARFGVKAFRVADAEEARRRLAECSDAGLQMMLQEYIPGAPTNHYFLDGFVDRDGVMKAFFARRRLRMNPPDFGNSTLMVSIAPNDVRDARSTLETLFEDIGYRGIFSAEFKRDERDGTFNLIEVNARPWWYVEFAARCGVNVCDLAVRDALGEAVPEITKYQIGRRCVFPYYDLPAVRAEMSAGRLGVAGWASSWIGAYQPVFRWTDPIPAFVELANLIGARLARGQR